MAKDLSGEIRRSQLITTYGVGAIVAVEDESFMVAGIDRWDVGDPNLHEPRLEGRLRVRGFMLPPASDKGSDDVPVKRFPLWAHCPSCHRLAHHKDFASLFKHHCGDCGVPLIPSRFVVCCERGHIDDFPYFNWVHAGSAPTGSTHQMTIETGGKTAALADIRITCSCKKTATMDNAFYKTSMIGVYQCKGRRPWLSTDDPDCDQVPRVLQRGASNVWFSITHSAISIPPWSEGAFKVLNKHWEMLRHIKDRSALVSIIDGMKLAERTPYSVEELVDAVEQRRSGEEAGDESSRPDFRRDEYQALVNGKPEESPGQEFVCTPAEDIPTVIRPWFNQVMVVPRLREVRALESFSRVSAAHPRPGQELPPLFDQHPGWLPAVEVLGEGVFFNLDPDRLMEWETKDNVLARTGRIDTNYRKRADGYGAAPDRVITPRLVLLHTLAHAVISQWSFDSGYPTAALAERLFVDEDMAGLLIYTATSDSAGSMGGVVAEADPERLAVSIPQALALAAWCSADPLCIEASVSGVDGLNIAACHSCALLPEVSCEEMNLLLDRGLLIGIPDDPDVGFFADLVPEV